jgi:acetyl-CoA C-acetyltransferase
VSAVVHTDPVPRTNPLDPRTPVLVGVGVASDDVEPAELMARAVVAAAHDAGSTSVLGAIDRMAVPQGNWAYPDPARLVADRVGAAECRTHLVELGIPQQSLINEALAAILGGGSDVAVIVGGEAKRRSQRAERSGQTADETPQVGVVPDVFHRRRGALLEPVEMATGLWEPVQQYAMIDNALRRAEGRSLDEHRDEIAELWARFNRVAVSNPHAAFPAPMSASEIDTPSRHNRPLAFPYNKWHSTQWTVDQAAALLVCSVGAARRFGISADRWVFPLVGLESSDAVSLLRRVAPNTWPAMNLLGARAAQRIGRPVADVDFAELYSCFPAAVRVQQRALGFGPETTPTVTGGMAFAGGPFNNFVYQATAAMVEKLRASPGALGMVTTVSGLLTKPGIGVWSTEPDDQPPLIADLADEAAAATETVEVNETLEEFTGEASVVTYTVTFEGGEPHRTVVIGLTPAGRRCVAFADNPDLARHAVSNELGGTTVLVRSGTFTLT